MTQPNEPVQPRTGPHAHEDPGTDHERFAGDPVDDPGYLGLSEQVDNANRNQTPEVDEFGARAVQSGDPDGEDRPNGDPRTVGHPVGGGERGPDVTGDEPAADEQADAEPAADRA